MCVSVSVCEDPCMSDPCGEPPHSEHCVKQKEQEMMMQGIISKEGSHTGDGTTFLAFTVTGSMPATIDGTVRNVL